MNAVAIGVAAAISVKFRQPELLMFALLFTMGLTFTSSTTLAMDSERRYAGAASALLGALCFASGGIVSPLVGLGNILVSTGVTFVVCAICSLLCALWAMRKVPMKVAMCRIFR